MIISKLIGGLGNQMFQYAVGRSLAMKNQVELKLDISGYDNQQGITPRKYGLGVFNISESFAFKSDVAKFSTNKLLKKLGFSRKGYLPESKPNFFDEGIFEHQGDVLLDGYWQTEKYFKDIRNVLLKDFTLKKEVDNLPKGLVEKIEQTNSVSLHVRRGDYVSNKNANDFHGTCTIEYYQEAIKYVAEKINQPEFFVFSDDIAWVKENIEIVFPVTYVSDGQLTDYEELALMSKCKHNIIANSSFSWWGAWLNQSQEKIVIAPKHWFADPRAKEGDIVPERWIRL